MHRSLKTLAAFGLAAAAIGAAPAPGVARFDWFEYSGREPGTVPAGAYRNPVLPGFYSDPSVVKVGADFYLVASTFAWFPGIPVFHSRDLVHWRQVGNAIDRPGQLDFKRLGMSRGVFAPAIAHHDGRFYIVNTCVDCGGNFVITATDPAGPWSDPKWLPTVGGIDPSLFFDDDGSAWIVNNREPVSPPRYEGHRALWIERFDPAAMKMLGNPRMIVDGGVEPAKQPVWIEGPHIFKRDSYYYLSAAEGGTSVNHSQVILRSAHVDGPYRPAPPGINPILTQRDLDPARPHPVTSAGHADMVRLDDGSWWSVFLATRPYAGDQYNTGRETFLLPVTWKDGWPSILPQGKAIPRFAALPPLKPDPEAAMPTGSFTVRDDFDGKTLAPYWMTMRAPAWRLDHGALLLETRADGIGDYGHPGMIARRQQHADATATTVLRFDPRGGAAGLAAIQNDDFFLTVALIRQGSTTQLRVARRAGPTDPAAGVTVATVPVQLKPDSPVFLRLHARGGRYDFDYALKPGRWLPVAHDVDGTNLSTEKAGGFVGTMIGPFAQRAR